MWRILGSGLERRLLSRHALRDSIVFGIVILFFESFLLLASGYMDQSFFLEGPNRGVLEHPGAWGIVFGDLIVFAAASSITGLLNKISRKFPAKRTPLARRYLAISRRRLLNSMFLRSKHRAIYLYVTCVALLFWLNNAYQTTAAVKYYGNELFDSFTYIYGYIAMRIVLFISWVVFTPYIAYICFCAAFTIYSMVKSLEKKKLLNFYMFHPDGCGGFSYLGNINVSFVFGMLVVYVELTIVLFTHHKLNPGLASGFVVATMFFVGASYAMLAPAHLFLIKEQKAMELSLFKKAFFDKGYGSAILSGYLRKSVSFNPYHAPQRTFLLTARVVPIAASTVRLYNLYLSS